MRHDLPDAASHLHDMPCPKRQLIHKPVTHVKSMTAKHCNNENVCTSMSN